MLGAKVILEYMQKFNQQRPMPTILMGDLNAKPHSKAVRYLREHNKEYPDIHLTDVYSALHCCSVGNTLHHFNGKIKVGAPPIDYIFVSDEFEVVDSKIITCLLYTSQIEPGPIPTLIASAPALIRSSVA